MVTADIGRLGITANPKLFRLWHYDHVLCKRDPGPVTVYVSRRSSADQRIHLALSRAPQGISVNDDHSVAVDYHRLVRQSLRYGRIDIPRELCLDESFLVARRFRAESRDEFFIKNAPQSCLVVLVFGGHPLFLQFQHLLSRLVLGGIHGSRGRIGAVK